MYTQAVHITATKQREHNTATKQREHNNTATKQREHNNIATNSGNTTSELGAVHASWHGPAICRTASRCVVYNA
jgi:hypothetical protein